jgi:OmpA-OmpF porin, OOP family
MKAIRGLTAAALLAAATAVQAQGAYFGVGAGTSDIDDGIAAGLITSGPVDGSDSGTKIFGGVRFRGPFALELAWTDLGKASYSGDFFGTPVTNGKVEVSGLNTSLVGLHRATDALEIFAKVGLYAWEAKASDTTGGAPFSGKNDGADLSLGFGANYYFTRQFGARLEWEHFSLDSDDASLLSASLLVRF